ncbi:MAG: hypothetical protein IT193_17145 [Propionibacteriaceae bacterium]|nr:hypothetical protein [Propionibacteriaceae bacterium]
MNTKHIVGGLVAAALSVSALAMTAPDAAAKGVRVRTSGACAASSDWKLKAKNDDGRIEVEFEVDSNRRGQRWAVTIEDNSKLVWSGRRTTKGPSGSFSVEKRIANRAGADAIEATATNLRTGETCVGTLTF